MVARCWNWFTYDVPSMVSQHSHASLDRTALLVYAPDARSRFRARNMTINNRARFSLIRCQETRHILLRVALNELRIALRYLIVRSVSFYSGGRQRESPHFEYGCHSYTMNTCDKVRKSNGTSIQVSTRLRHTVSTFVSNGPDEKTMTRAMSEPRSARGTTIVTATIARTIAATIVVLIAAVVVEVVIVSVSTLIAMASYDVNVDLYE